MSQLVAAQLKAGIIFGDTDAGEYVYAPAGEVGVDSPVCVLETAKDLQDISLEEAVALVSRLSLKPARHPRMGYRSY